ncbi:MAG TPA: hypothetical protein VJ866_17715 [Pyrinomonadaceae bacterium]|nr:hypothetical protein [Pyrinomonadaceae bacterium]
MSLLTLEEVEQVKGACEVESAFEEALNVPGEIIGTYNACEDGGAVKAWADVEAVEVRDEAGGGERKRGFWARQFAGEPTEVQTRFDVVFGIVVPILCFIFDPVVFQDKFGGGVGGFYRGVSFYAYTLSAAEILALGCWLYFGARASRWAAPAAGVFLAGALFSFVLGVAILPLSIFGLIFLVGALGFVPFVTALVYLRVGVRALRLVLGDVEAAGRASAWITLGLLFTLVAPAAAQHGARRAVSSAFAEELAGREMSAPRRTTTRVLAKASGATFDEAVWAYNRETDPARRARLAKAYADVTGNDIEARLERLQD